MRHIDTNRLHGLDALRACALLLGVVFHAALAYTPGDQFWLLMDPDRSAGLAVTGFILHMFRMSLFFVLAGYFGRMMILRLGTGGFIRNRLSRIALPLAVFWPIVFASFIGLLIWMAVVANGGTFPENPPPPEPLTAETFPLTHLWFLYILLLLYAGLLFVRAAAGVLGLKNITGQVIDSILASKVAAALPLILAVPVFAAIYDAPVWFAFHGIPAPDRGFVPNSIALTGYSIAVLAGWALQRKPENLASVTRYWPFNLGLAAVLTLFCLTTTGTSLTYAQMLPGADQTEVAAAYALGIWCWTFGFIGLAQRFWSQENRIGRYLADASYWIYIIHLPIVTALQIWLSQYDFLAELKFVIILFIAVPLMLGSYQLLVRYTWIGKFLNGKKHERTKPANMEEITA